MRNKEEKEAESAGYRPCDVCCD